MRLRLRWRTSTAATGAGAPPAHHGVHLHHRPHRPGPPGELAHPPFAGHPVRGLGADPTPAAAAGQPPADRPDPAGERRPLIVDLLPGAPVPREGEQPCSTGVGHRVRPLALIGVKAWQSITHRGPGPFRPQRNPPSLPAQDSIPGQGGHCLTPRRFEFPGTRLLNVAQSSIPGFEGGKARPTMSPRARSRLSLQWPQDSES